MNVNTMIERLRALEEEHGGNVEVVVEAVGEGAEAIEEVWYQEDRDVVVVGCAL